MPIKQRTKRLVQRRFDKKQNRPNIQYGLLGDGSGNLYPPGKENHVYARVNGRKTEVYNIRIPASYGLPVTIGYDPTDPFQQQVLSARSRLAKSSGVDTPANGFAPASYYGWGGEDPVLVDLRQHLPLRISSLGGLSIAVQPGPAKLGGVRTAIEYQILNLASMVPGTVGKAKLVLATLDTDGDLVATGGSELDVTALLDFSSAPETPINTAYELALIRLYHGQTVIREANEIDPDIFDIRGTVMSAVYSGNEGLNSPSAWLALNEITSLDNDDLFLTLDVSANEIKKFKKSNLPSGGSSNYIEMLVNRVLYDNTLTENGCWDVDFTALDAWSSAIDDLEIVLNVRGSVSASYDVVKLYFNNDTIESNYRESRYQYDGSTYVGTADDATLASSTAGASPANTFTQIHVRIANVQASMSKQVFCEYSARGGTTSQLLALRTMDWENTDAITRVKVCVDGYPTDGFVSGSRIRIIGRQKMNVAVSS